MPPIVEGRCSACNAVAARTSDRYMAIFMDEAARELAHQDDPHLIILAHPGESRILAKLGFTFQTAALSGRLVSVSKVFCKECGQSFEIRHLTTGLGVFGCFGFVILVALAIPVGVGIALLVDNWIGCIAGFVTLGLLSAAVDSAVTKFILSRYAERAKRVATSARCPACGSREFGTPVELQREPIPCRACGQREVRFKMIGKS